MSAARIHTAASRCDAGHLIDENDPRQGRALAAALLLVLAWGASFTIQKVAYQAMGPGAFLFARSLLMGVCAAGLLLWRGRAPWPQVQAGERGGFALLVAVGPVLHIALVTYGIHWTTAFSSALLMACGPVFTLVLLRVLRGTRVRRAQVLGVALAFAGVLLFMSEKLLGSNWRAGGGDAVLLLAAALFSLYTIWVAPFVERHGGVVTMCWTTVCASPVLMVVSAFAAWQAPYASVGAGIWAAFLWTVLVSAFLGWMVWGWINAVRGVARTAPLMYLIPPVAGAVAWLVAGESFGGMKLAGALLVLGGVAATQLAGRRRADA